MANDEAALLANPPAGERPVHVEAAFGLRAYRGSREAIFRAALDLFDATPWLVVTRRSLVWQATEAGAGTAPYLCAAIGVTAQLSIERLAATARVIEVRLGASEGQLGGNTKGPEGPGPVVIDLLWAWDSEGQPKPVAPPMPRGAPVGPAPHPPPPPGRTYLSPDIATRASACGPLAEVAPDAQDPVTGDWLSKHLKTVPEPYIEAPVPFAAEFKTVKQRTDRSLVILGEARDQADLFAAAAEGLGWAPPSAVPMELSPVRPDVEIPVQATVAEGASDEARLLAWVRAVAALLESERLRLRRAVVLSSTPTSISGLLFGSIAETADRRGDPTTAKVSFQASWQKWRYELSLT